MTFSQMQSKYFLSRLAIVKEAVEGREMAGNFRYLRSSTVELGWITPVKLAGRDLYLLEATVQSAQRWGEQSMAHKMRNKERKVRVLSRCELV